VNEVTREEALELIKERVHTPELIHHMQATAAIMEGLAARLGQDEEKWYLTGLLHDIDYEETKDDTDRHSLVAAEWLQELGFDEELVYAVKVHNDHEGMKRTTLLDKALYATDPLSGLITATAYVMPTRTLAQVRVKSIKKKFKDKAFARGANREQIRAIEELGIELNEFFEIALTRMQEIAASLDLA
jgi:putative nucleotidyltransferase with HDIG domain